MLTRNVRIAMLASMAILMLAGAAVAQETSIRIAVIDLDRLVAQSVAGIQLQNKLETFQKQVRDEGNRLVEKASATQKLIADGANSLSEDRLNELQKQFEDEQIAIERFRKDKQREGQKIQAEGLQKIEEQLQPVLEKIQSEGNYDLILNRALGFVVMASERVDITDTVIRAFDAATQGDGGAAADGD